MPEIKEYLESRSVFFNALKVLIGKSSRLTNRLTPSSYKKSEPDPNHYFVYINEKVSTVFAPEYRLIGLDLSDPRIEEGRRIIFRALDELNTRFTSEGISFIVLIIPTKELVFKNIVESTVSDIPPAYSKLIENEELLLATAISRFEDYGIRYVNPLPQLRKLIHIGVNPYPRTHDSHPTAAGYQAIVKAVATHPHFK